MQLDVAITSLITLLASPGLLGLVVLAVPIGMFFGAVPGLGGKLGIAMLIPFVFGMQPLAGAVFLVSMHAVVHTGGSIPSILFGIPGTGPDAATVVDGYPMAKKGEAGRALGASLGASGVGGVIGAIVLALLLPVLRPVVLSFGPAEFFLLAILGITFIAALSGDSLIKGLIVGCFGLMLAFVGLDPMTGIARFTFGQLFLWDGVDVITAVLALYAIPEMIALGIRGGSVSAISKERANYGIRNVVEGLTDVFRHWGLTIRTSIIGAFIGLVPGLGGDAASWICYGHAVQSSRTPERFGKGAVEGVIAPEAANNSKEGGALLPTLFFGIPGSSGMVLLLGAFVVLGIQPGPQLILNHLDLVWTLVWALVLANVIAVLMFLGIARWLGLLAFVRGGLLVPLVFLLAITGSYLGSGSWHNLILLLLLGVLGYGLKRFDWPRPPFVIGLILGEIAEVSLHKALAIWGPVFLLRPQSLVLLLMVGASLLFYLWRRRATGRALMKVGGNAIIGAVMLTIFAGMLAMAAQYPHEARFMPILVGLPGAALCVVLLWQAVAADRREVLTGGEEAAPAPLRREMLFLGWFAGFIAGIVALGFLIAGPALVFAFLVINQRENIMRAAALAVGCLAVLYLVFEVLLELTLFRGLAAPLLFG